MDVNIDITEIAAEKAPQQLAGNRQNERSGQEESKQIEINDILEEKKVEEQQERNKQNERNDEKVSKQNKINEIVKGKVSQ